MSALRQTSLILVVFPFVLPRCWEAVGPDAAGAWGHASFLCLIGPNVAVPVCYGWRSASGGIGASVKGRRGRKEAFLPSPLMFLPRLLKKYL